MRRSYCGRHYVEYEASCPLCRPERDRQDRAERGSAYQRGYDRRWARVRRLRLDLDRWICQRCGGVAAMVDHVIPLRERPDLRLALANLQSLCWRCHAAKTREDARER